MILALILWGLLMANKFDSGYAMVPVAHPSGEAHTIAVPEGTDIEDFHAALGDAGYHHDLPQPTKEGAVEYSPSFRKAAQSALAAVDNGRNPYAEAGFSIAPNGAIGSLRKDVTFPGKTPQDKITYSPDDLAVLHTHPNASSSKPSQIDTEAAKKIKKVIYVASKDGLFAVGPDGKPQQVFKSPTWYSDKEPK